MGKVGGRLGKESWPVVVEFCTCLVSVHTAIAGTTGLVLTTGVFGGKYRPDATEYTIAVDDNGGG